MFIVADDVIITSHLSG